MPAHSIVAHREKHGPPPQRRVSPQHEIPLRALHFAMSRSAESAGFTVMQLAEHLGRSRVNAQRICWALQQQGFVRPIHGAYTRRARGRNRSVLYVATVRWAPGGDLGAEKHAVATLERIQAEARARIARW